MNQRLRWVFGLVMVVSAIFAVNYGWRYQRLYNGLPKTPAALGPGPGTFKEIHQYRFDSLVWLCVFLVMLVAFVISFLWHEKVKGQNRSK